VDGRRHLSPEAPLTTVNDGLGTPVDAIENHEETEVPQAT